MCIRDRFVAGRTPQLFHLVNDEDDLLSLTTFLTNGLYTFLNKAVDLGLELGQPVLEELAQTFPKTAGFLERELDFQSALKSSKHSLCRAFGFDRGSGFGHAQRGALEIP